MDAPLCVFINGAAGNREAEQLATRLECDIPIARRGGIFLAEHAEAVPETLHQAMASCEEKQGILVIAGGDGTLNSALPEVLARQLTLGLIPRGTFNLFARAHGIASDPEVAIAQLLTARPTALPVYWLNELPFLVNASVGLYPRVIAERERHQKLAWRSRPTALLSGLLTVLRRQRGFAVRINADGDARALRATTVFVTGNSTQLETLNLADQDCLAQGKLALLILRPVSLRGMLSLLAHGALGRLAEHERLECLCASVIELRMRKPLWRVSVDGELHQCSQPLHIRIQPNALTFLLPARP